MTLSNCLDFSFLEGNNSIVFLVGLPGCCCHGQPKWTVGEGGNDDDDRGWFFTWWCGCGTSWCDHSNRPACADWTLRCVGFFTDGSSKLGMMATLMRHQRSLIAYPSSITLDMSRLIESMTRKKKKKKVLLFFGETRERECCAGSTLSDGRRLRISLSYYTLRSV